MENNLFFELCRLVGIYTFEDLKRFKDDYRLEYATIDTIVKALGIELVEGL